MTEDKEHRLKQKLLARKKQQKEKESSGGNSKKRSKSRSRSHNRSRSSRSPSPNTKLVALDKEIDTNLLTLKKKPEMIKIGHNGFKYKYRGVSKNKNKYRAQMHCKNPATSSAPHIRKCLGTHEYATEAAKACDDYLIATNGDKRKLNFASESEYNLALDEE